MCHWLQRVRQNMAHQKDCSCFDTRVLCYQSLAYVQHTTYITHSKPTRCDISRCAAGWCGSNDVHRWLLLHELSQLPNVGTPSVLHQAFPSSEGRSLLCSRGGPSSIVDCRCPLRHHPIGRYGPPHHLSAVSCQPPAAETRWLWPTRHGPPASSHLSASNHSQAVHPHSGIGEPTVPRVGRPTVVRIRVSRAPPTLPRLKAPRLANDMLPFARQLFGAPVCIVAESDPHVSWSEAFQI